MALTTAQKNELAGRLVGAQQSGNYGSFNDLVKQLRLTQKDLLDNFPAINQAGINEQISRGAVVPTTAPAAVTYTTAQIQKAIEDSLAAGFTVQQARMGAMTNFGVSQAEFDKALGKIQSAPSQTFSDERVAQAIRDSLAQGFTLDQARQGAMTNYGVGSSQFDRAMRLVNESNLQFRGSAPTYQFPGLLTDRREMPTGAQRFISGTPGSLLYDVPRVENAEFVFRPGAFDYEAIRASQIGTVNPNEGLDMPTTQPQAAKGTTTVAATTPTTTPTTTPPKTTPTKYTDARVAQALRESMAQGFSLQDSIAGAMRVYGVSSEQANRAAGLLDTGTMRQPQSARTTQATPQTQEELVARLRAAREAAGLPSDPTQWTNADRVKAAEIQNEIQGLGEFGRLVVNPETGVTSRTPVQMFSTLPEDQRARAENYLSSVVPIVAERALSGGGGWNDLTMLSNQYRINPNELLGFMSPDQRAQFQERFGYQIEGPATNSRLFGSPLSIRNITGTIGGQPTFTPEFSPYLEQAARLLPSASPETQAYLRQAIYSGATQGDFSGIPLDPSQYQNFGVPWWLQGAKLGQGIEALASGDPGQFYRQQALQSAQGPLSNIFSDAATRTNYGSIGGFDVTASKYNTPYIEDINLYGDRAISRLRDQYGLSDDQISGLLDLVPRENLVLGTDNFGRPVYPGEIGSFIAQRARTPGGGFTGEEIMAMARENLPTQAAPLVSAPITVPTTPIAPIVPVTPSTPTTPGLLSQSYSDAQVAQAIIDSLGQGFNVDQARIGAMSNFGVGQDQFGRALGMLPGMGYTIGQGFA